VVDAARMPVVWAARGSAWLPAPPVGFAASGPLVESVLGARYISEHMFDVPLLGQTNKELDGWT
jgi:hypothetical protein